MTLFVLRSQPFYVGIEETFICVCDVSKENADVLQELNLAQVTVAHVAAAAKNSSDKKLQQEMRRFVDTHTRGRDSRQDGVTVVLISGDVDFLSDLHDFKHRKFVKIILLHNKVRRECQVVL